MHSNASVKLLKNNEQYIKCGKYALNLGDLLRYIGNIVRRRYEALLECDEHCRKNPVRCWYSLMGETVGVLFNFIIFLFDVVEHGHRRDSKYVAELRTVLENAFNLDQWLRLKLKAILKMFNHHKLDTAEEEVT